jgi:hypothetical protein
MHRTELSQHITIGLQLPPRHSIQDLLIRDLLPVLNLVLTAMTTTAYPQAAGYVSQKGTLRLE